MKTKMALTLIALAGAALPASAATYLVELQGDVYYNNGDVAEEFPIGTKASAWFSYDVSSKGRAVYPGGVLDPTVFFYENAPIAGGMSIGDYLVTFSNSARMFVTNQEAVSDGRIIDRILFDDHTPFGNPVNGRQIDAVSISWQDDTATALTDLLLQNSAAAFYKFPSVIGTIDWTPYLGAAHRVSFIATQQRITEMNGAVPEPSTWLMMIFGFGAIGATMRQRLRLRKSIYSTSEVQRHTGAAIKLKSRCLSGLLAH